ncbi:MAG: hypothetical protein J0H49_24575 [Acidobacteria bacterium]|nr:hypothetical protein [Acidobacteriota bacterium]
MPIVDFRGKRLSRDIVVERYKKDYKAHWDAYLHILAHEANLAENQLRGFFAPYYQAGQANVILGVALGAADVHIKALTEMVNPRRQFRPEWRSRDGAIEVQVISTAFEAKIGMAIELNKDFPAAGPTATRRDHSAKPNWMEITAKIAIQGNADGWELGLIQTVSVLRKARVAEKGHRAEYKWEVVPHRDGPKDYDRVWYDPKSFEKTRNEAFQLCEVGLKDQPSIAFSTQTSVTVETIEGVDHFYTWLVLVREGRQNSDEPAQALFLYEWKWQNTYDSANKANAGIRLLSESGKCPSKFHCVFKGPNMLNVIDAPAHFTQSRI